MKLDVLAIAAHPDDVELSCSGTLIAETKAGKKCGIIDLTAGELGTRGTPEIRLAEAEEARKRMDLSVRENLHLSDGFFRVDKPTLLKVIAAIRKFQPEVVLTNALYDRHPDHGRASDLVKEACFLSGLRRIETVDNNESQQPWRPANLFHFIQDRYIQPGFVYDITDVMNDKLEAIRAFKSQFDTQPDNEPQTYISTPYFLQSIVDRARMMGKMIGVEFAEGFVSEKMIGITSFQHFVQKIT